MSKFPFPRGGSDASAAVQLFVIALEGSPRVRELESELANRGLDWVRVSAVDGRALPEADLNRIADRGAGLLLYGRALSATEIGCLLSHRAAYDEFLRGTSEWALILEDDAFPEVGLQEFMEWLTQWRAQQPTIVECFSSGRVNEGPNSRQLSATLSLVRLRTYPGFTVAYAINRRAAEQALEYRVRVASRADWPPWAVDVTFWRTEPNVFAHGRPGEEPTSTIVRGDLREARRHKATRWLRLLSGATFVTLRENYPGGLRQYYRHAVLPSALYWRARVARAVRRRL